MIVVQPVGHSFHLGSVALIYHLHPPPPPFTLFGPCGLFLPLSGAQSRFRERSLSTSTSSLGLSGMSDGGSPKSRNLRLKVVLSEEGQRTLKGETTPGCCSDALGVERKTAVAVEDYTLD